jgi:hypothetical protein
MLKELRPVFGWWDLRDAAQPGPRQLFFCFIQDKVIQDTLSFLGDHLDGVSPIGLG